jgi:hypothetical protein
MSKEAVEKAPNYTPELENRVRELYDGGKGMSIKDIAAEINRSERSVRGKLVHMGVYVKADKPVAEYRPEGPSKKEYLASLEALGFSEEALKGLGNATKPALAEVIDKVRASA